MLCLEIFIWETILAIIAAKTKTPPPAETSPPLAGGGWGEGESFRNPGIIPPPPYPSPIKGEEKMLLALPGDIYLGDDTGHNRRQNQISPSRRNFPSPGGRGLGGGGKLPESRDNATPTLSLPHQGGGEDLDDLYV